MPPTTPTPPTDLDALADAIDECMLRDRADLRSRLRRVRSLTRARKPHDRALTRLRERIDRSRQIAQRRRANLPTINYPSDLPVSARRQEIADAIRDNQVVVICGETGSGKTTQLPKICLELGRGVVGAIGHTQPRRVAARTVAARIASELGVARGRQVGSKVRFTDETSDQTLVKLMTDGLLLAETQNDRQLLGYDTIIVDEAHERSLNIDFLLGYLRGLLPQRPDLRIIITSATIDPDRFSKHFADAPIIEVSGRTYPIDIRYEPVEGADTDEPDVEGGVLRAVGEAMNEGQGDVLVFATGEREIRDLAESLRGRFADRAEVLPLYARLGVDEQERVFAPHKGRRIVLATNVAETSITVPGIRWVVDPGYARISRFGGRSRIRRLPIEKISRASANQRAGRCGRIGPGTCIRLYSRADFEERPEFTDPETIRTDLAGVILQMAALRLGDVEKFPFIDPPDRRQIRAGKETLHELGAIDDRHELTDIGRDLAALPVEPRIGRMLVAAHDHTCLREALIIASALSVQDPRVRPTDKQAAADLAHRPFQDESSDFQTLLNIWDAYHDKRRELSRSKHRAWCSERFLSYPRMREWVETHRQLCELAKERGWSIGNEAPSYARLHQALLTGLLSFVGKKGEKHEYDAPGGVKFAIFPGSSLFSAQPQWVMAAEMVRTSRLYARTCAKIEARWLERAAGALLKRTYADAHWRRKGGRVYAYENATLGGLPVVRRRPIHYGPINPAACRDLFIHHALVDGDCDLDAECLRHNDELIQEVERLEAKTRRTDLLADVRDRFSFYDARVPKNVYTAMAFEEWRRHAEKTNPTLLYMERADVLREAPSDDPAQEYPDEVKSGARRLPVDYALAPGDTEDGMTVRVPLAQLHEVSDDALSWQAPGLIRERIVERIRALPKDLRTAFIPAPNFARRAMERLNRDDGSLDEAIARALEKVAGVAIPRDVWKQAPLPPHVRLNYRVVDDSGETVGQGRDLDRLRRSLASQTAKALAKIEHEKFNRDNLTDWDMGDLPQSVVVETDAGAVTAYPALVEDGERVHLRLLPSKERAAIAMRAGVRRLFMVHCAQEMKYQRSRLQERPELKIAYMPVGDPDELIEHILARAAERVFVGDETPVRTRADFDRLLDIGWNMLTPTIDEVTRLAEHILAQRRDIMATLDSAPATWDAVRADITARLDRLMPHGFLRDVPFEWLQQFPRYLEGEKIRLGRLRAGGADALAQDAARAEQARRCEHALAEANARRTNASPPDPALSQFRWMIEEFRVYLLAERLGTRIPVSPERMEAQWAKVRS